MPLSQVPSKPAWQGKLHALWGDGNPAIHDLFWTYSNTAVTAAGPTPAQITTTVGRLVSFRFETPIQVSTVQFFGAGTAPSQYTAAVYAETSLLWTQTGIQTTASTWGSISASFHIPAQTQCWFGIGSSGTSTGAGFRTPGAPIANSIGILSPPTPQADYGARFASVTLSSGVWPNTLPAFNGTPTWLSAGTTGTVPIFLVEA